MAAHPHEEFPGVSPRAFRLHCHAIIFSEKRKAKSSSINNNYIPSCNKYFFFTYLCALFGLYLRAFHIPSTPRSGTRQMLPSLPQQYIICSVFKMAGVLMDEYYLAARCAANFRPWFCSLWLF